MKLKITKGIPLPPPSRSGLTGTLRSMQVGDSTLVPIEASTRARVHNIASRLKRRKEGVWTIRSVNKGWRIWRTA